MTVHTFPTAEPILLYVELGRGSLHVTADASAEPETTVEIEGPDAETVAVSRSGREIAVVAPRRTGFFAGDSPLTVRVQVPAGSDLDLRTGSAAIEVRGPVAVVKAKSGSGQVDVESADGPAVLVTGSGDVRIEEARSDLRVKSGSGDVAADVAAASLVVSTGSGDVRLGHTGGSAVVKTGSGDLQVTDVAADLSWTSGSGDLLVGSVRRGRLSIKGASGDVRLGVPAGVPVWTDISTVSGQIHSQLASAGEPAEGQDHVEVRARTVSGDVLLLEA